MLKKLTVAVSLAAIFSSTSMAAVGLRGAEGTFKNVDSAINQAVEKASRLFEENHGNSMSSDFNLISSAKNPYLQKLSITKDYRVELKFMDAAKKTDSYEVPVAKGLLGMDIVLIPVYNRGDEKVSSWECLTNADRNLQEFMGDTAKEYAASYIREASRNSYLSTCTYVNKDLVKGASGSSGNSGNSGNNGNSGNGNNGKGNGNS